MSISTKNVKVSTGGSLKTIAPGNVTAKINSVTLQDFKFQEGAKELILHLESEPVGDDFVGFLIDKDDPEKGHHKGLIGRVRTYPFAYAEGEVKDREGKLIRHVNRDEEILKALKMLCNALGITQWFNDQDDKHDTIDDFVRAFDEEKPFKDIWLDWCIAGREYLNDEGFVNYNLYLPKFTKGNVLYEKTGTKSGKLLTYDPKLHLRKTEDKKTVSHFGGEKDSAVPAVETPKSKDPFDL